MNDASSLLRHRHIIVVGLGFGDESKGATTDHLCSIFPNVAAVVRYNGGAQAAHNVIAEGKHHTFRQFGSGTLAGVPTFLSRHVLVEPMALAAEAEELAAVGVPNPLSMMTVDPDALLTTPIHVAVNRIREDARGAGRHGSCGLGIGETTWYDLAARRNSAAGDVVEGIDVPSDVRSYAPRVGDCRNPAELRNKLVELARFYSPLLRGSRHTFPAIDSMVNVYRLFADAVRIEGPEFIAREGRRGQLVFEGAQGVLLDEWRGFHPNTTWSTTTPLNAQTLLHEAGLEDGYVLGAVRAYGTRHGAGPFPGENYDPAGLAAEQHNGVGEYQGSWRVAPFDQVLLRYALEVCGHVDGIALSHLDVPTSRRTIVAYDDDCYRLDVGEYRDLVHQQALGDYLRSATPRYSDVRPQDLIAELGVPVVVEASGPARSNRRMATSPLPLPLLV